MENKKVIITLVTTELNGDFQQLYNEEIICQSYDVIFDALEDIVNFLFDGQKIHGNISTGIKQVVIDRFTCTNNGYFIRKVTSVKKAFEIEEREIKEQEDFEKLFECDEDADYGEIFDDIKEN